MRKEHAVKLQLRFPNSVNSQIPVSIEDEDAAKSKLELRTNRILFLFFLKRGVVTRYTLHLAS